MISHQRTVVCNRMFSPQKKTHAPNGCLGRVYLAEGFWLLRLEPENWRRVDHWWVGSHMTGVTTENGLLIFLGIRMVCILFFVFVFSGLPWSLKVSLTAS